MMNNLDNIIGVNEAAEKWGLAPGYVKNLCRRGKIQAKKIGTSWVIVADQDINARLKEFETEQREARVAPQHTPETVEAETLEYYADLYRGFQTESSDSGDAALRLIRVLRAHGYSAGKRAAIYDYLETEGLL